MFCLILLITPLLVSSIFSQCNRNVLQSATPSLIIYSFKKKFNLFQDKISTLDNLFTQLIIPRRLDKTKYYEIGSCCFSAKHAVLRRKSRYLLSRNKLALIHTEIGRKDRFRTKLYDKRDDSIFPL